MTNSSNSNFNDPLTETVIGSAYKVLNTLGPGFLEKVYENALAFELRKQGFSVQQQKPLAVYYEDEEVGAYVCDLLVENKLIIELKTVKSIITAHVKQRTNYLRATGYRTCLLLNFDGPTLGIRRVENPIPQNPLNP